MWLQSIFTLPNWLIAEPPPSLLALAHAIVGINTLHRKKVTSRGKSDPDHDTYYMKIWTLEEDKPLLSHKHYIYKSKPDTSFRQFHHLQLCCWLKFTMGMKRESNPPYRKILQKLISIESFFLSLSTFPDRLATQPRFLCGWHTTTNTTCLIFAAKDCRKLLMTGCGSNRGSGCGPSCLPQEILELEIK